MNEYEQRTGQIGALHYGAGERGADRSYAPQIVNRQISATEPRAARRQPDQARHPGNSHRRITIPKLNVTQVQFAEIVERVSPLGLILIWPSTSRAAKASGRRPFDVSPGAALCA